MPPAENNGQDKIEWSYRPGSEPGPANNQPADASSEAISWTASEFIDHDKSPGWYLAFFVGLVAVSVAAYLFTKDYISGGAIFVAGLVLVAAIKKRPRQLPYEINAEGIRIGGKFYAYEGFKSFGLTQDGGMRSVNLMPLKRFMPDLSIYFPPEHEKAIVEILSTHLPHSDHVEKAMDKLAKRLHF